MLGVNCRTSSSSCISPSHPGYHSVAETEVVKTVLNMSPRVSSQSHPQIVHLERTLRGHATWHWDSEETMMGCNSREYIPTTATPSHKSSVELRKEIVMLEAEIMRLEQYLLSLYRTAFEEHMSSLSSISETRPNSEMRSPPRKIGDGNEISQKIEPRARRSLLRQYQSSPAHGWVSSDTQSCASSFKTTLTRERKNASSGHRSLADHLSPSCLESSLISPDRLSEDIVRCISSIYCKLANPTSTQGGFSTSSPTSSLSSSSIFSSHNPRDSWSPCRNEDSSMHRELHVLREENGPYNDMVEVLRICLDDDSFKFAAAMLQKFRSLVRSLEKVDPSKMKREEKLAFWINIHNALVMHAYLAYGTGTRVKSSTILKAAYSIGGHCINAYVIQNSILGIRSHNSSPWIQTLFSPSRKSKNGSSGHVYALEYAEPLVHFALCSGAYSDPPVRVYTAKNIFLYLKLAKEDFIQANVYIHKEMKIFLPRILYYFAKDMALPTSGLLETVNECLSEVQQKAIKSGMKGGRLDKYINWLPENSTFRYVFHGELARGAITV
ncbi:uncharacterized protein LOC116215566 isoform X1 [Punica granatum]|uniref:Uncharacterized protein LOC116215566 isoform X1 n=1 Tax=Punica granatum TaxID=22663 RepID=A0A6P8EMP1_PUNGR|nr:uncharacterized protein LOC116215566 isoform X1 [Punica granatum]XP_031407180.1 uncharacterized protein LOC116215566 isoform X1 [Punica granatum]XP_031407181.1 uncharacterized protein LOC116215566 isoform X1 [Punica granatum]XP_031407182.1 uncharacterized protein LOC116215566 isoform X1 [Punica granatum]XP_031407183.1 uncharacterized protein LOC116215566 isoform X1 [Punica granatum]XP_031407184.1 uncharacterized protein LOC116215566 isoform X1 [Punica granatum]